ncbi:MAG: glycosyltransferase family 4 protein, partial [Frankia sp.]|nr:glycosyltransferase family 4 protein [Frankia sp.]
DLPVAPRGATLTETPRPLRRGRRFPARALHALWSRVDWPPVEVLSGSLDVFHATNFVLPPTRRAAGVVTIHDLSYLRHADTVSAATLRYRELVPRGLARARAVVADTQTVGDEIAAEYGVGADRLVVAPLGLSATWLSPPPPYDARELRNRGWPERFVLFVGNLEPRKNLPVLLAAHRRLRETVLDAPPLVLAGPPGWGPALQLDAARDAVVLTGYLDEPELARLMGAATCLVLPSRYEGFGIPPLEALACGIPVVVSDLPVLREVLGAHAHYVPVGDVDALADALGVTIGRATDATAAVARREHARQFTWERCAEATMRAYMVAACR